MTWQVSALDAAGMSAADPFEANGPLAMGGKPIDAAVRQALLSLCARYLCLGKKRRGALDPVAGFHLRNGAVCHRGSNRSSPLGMHSLLRCYGASAFLTR